MQPRDSRSTLDLFRAAHQGCPDSLGHLLERIRPRLRRWAAAKIGPPIRSFMDAEDIVQDILTRAYRSIPEFVPDHDRAFHAWIFTIGRNVVRDAARYASAGCRTTENQEDVHSGISGREPTPSQVAVGLEAEERFIVALASLPERSRTVIRLRRLERLSTRETADRMEIKPGHVAVLLGRALSSLAEAMSA